MSYIPYLRQPPMHTQSGTIASSKDGLVGSLSASANDTAATVMTTSATDPFGPRQWHSNLVKLSGKNRALNEFSVERIDEENDQNLVMLHGESFWTASSLWLT